MSKTNDTGIAIVTTKTSDIFRWSLGAKVKLKEYENDGRQWVYVGHFEDVAERDVEETVRKFQDGNRKFVLIDDDDEFVKEFPP